MVTATALVTEVSLRGAGLEGVVIDEQPDCGACLLSAVLISPGQLEVRKRKCKERTKERMKTKPVVRKDERKKKKRSNNTHKHI